MKDIEQMVVDLPNKIAETRICILLDDISCSKFALVFMFGVVPIVGSLIVLFMIILFIYACILGI